MVYLPWIKVSPLDEEVIGDILHYKLQGKAENIERYIGEVNINSYDPWDLRLKAKVQGRGLVWYFFSKKENKYGRGNQQNRRTPSGFWKPTGNRVDIKDHRQLYCETQGGEIGYKSVLVFQTERKLSSKSDWVMHEFHHTLFPEPQRTHVVCRLEYKGNDMNILSYNPIISPPTFVANTTDSVFDQGFSRSYNTLPEYESANQGQQFAGHLVMDQSFQGNSGSLDNYDSANQVLQFGGDFNVGQSVQKTLGSFDNSFDFGLENQRQWFPSYFNMQQQAPYSALCQEEPKMIYHNDIQKNYEYLGDQMTFSQENYSDYWTQNPATGVLAGFGNDSGIDTMIGRETWSSTDMVGGSSNGSYSKLMDEIPPFTTIEPLHEALEQPKQLYMQLPGKEKMIYSQEMDVDSVNKAPSTKAVKKMFIALEEMSQNCFRPNWLNSYCSQGDQ